MYIYVRYVHLYIKRVTSELIFIFLNNFGEIQKQIKLRSSKEIKQNSIEIWKIFKKKIIG